MSQELRDRLAAVSRELDETMALSFRARGAKLEMLTQKMEALESEQRLLEQQLANQPPNQIPPNQNPYANSVSKPPSAYPPAPQTAPSLYSLPATTFNA